jgi:glycosyltransferase involved in cell wall biosynthesis
MNKMTDAACNEQPIVSVVVPCLNEVASIPLFLTNILEFNYPMDRLQIFILDGLSKDGTREIIESFMSKYSSNFNSFRLIDNPGANKAKALNKGIELASGEVVMRLDVHARYSINYVQTLVDLLFQDTYVNVGAVRNNVQRETTMFGDIVSLALSSKIGVGNAPQYLLKEGVKETEVVHLFCVRKQIFDKIGMFDERLTRGQDRDFNMRIRDAGLKAAVTSKAESNYFIRSEMKDLAQWIIACGMTPFRVQQITGRKSVSLRHFMPLSLFLVSTALVYFQTSILITFLAMYYAVATTSMLFEKSDKVRLPVVFLCPPVLFVLHYLYGLGSLIGILTIFRTRTSSKIDA